VKGPIKDYISGALQKTLISSLQREIQKVIDKELSKLPLYIPIKKDGLAVDYSLLSAPKMSNQHVILSITGTLVDLTIPETKNPPFIMPENIPDFDPAGKSIQMFLSDYTIKSVLNTMHKSERIKIKLKSEDVPKELPVQFNTTSLDLLLPGLEKLYGPNKRANLICLSDKNHTSPSVELTSENVKGLISMDCALEVNTEGETFDKATNFATSFNFSANISLSENGTISAALNDAKFFDSKMIESKIPDIKIENFEFLTNFALQLVIPVLNTQISEATIRIPTIEGISFTDSTATILPNFVELNVSPKFN